MIPLIFFQAEEEDTREILKFFTFMALDIYLICPGTHARGQNEGQAKNFRLPPFRLITIYKTFGSGIGF